MSLSSYINYHRRPRAQYVSVSEYNNKFNTNVEAPPGFEEEFQSALMEARRTTDPNDFVQHNFMNMRGSMKKSRGLRKGPGLSGRKAGKTYRQWGNKPKGSSSNHPGTVSSVVKSPVEKSEDDSAKRLLKEADSGIKDGQDTLDNSYITDVLLVKKENLNKFNAVLADPASTSFTVKDLKEVLGKFYRNDRPDRIEGKTWSELRKPDLVAHLKKLIKNKRNRPRSPPAPPAVQPPSIATNEDDLESFLDDYEEDASYEEIDPSSVAANDAFDAELDAFLDSTDVNDVTDNVTEEMSDMSTSPKAKEVSLQSQIDSFLSEAAQDSETYARDRAHVIHFSTGSGSLKSQLMKGRERYMKRLSDWLNGDKNAKIRMMDNKEVLVSSLRPNRDSLKKMLKTPAGEPRFCSCDK